MTQPSYVVATDLSTASRDACDMAARLAARAGARVDIVCILPREAASEETGMTQRVGAVLDGMVDAARARGVTAKGHVLLGDDAAEGIVKYAEKRGAEMIVAAPHGATGWRKFVLGSVTERLLRHAPAQIMLARPKRVSLANVLIAVDRSRGAARALRKGLELAKTMGAKVRVLEVLRPPGVLAQFDDALSMRTPHVEKKGRLKRAKGEFTEWVAEFVPDGLEVDVQIAEGSAPEQIIRSAKQFKASLIVIGTHGKSRTEEFLVGGVSRAVATTAPVSVILVRDRPPRKKG